MHKLLLVFALLACHTPQTTEPLPRTLALPAKSMLVGIGGHGVGDEVAMLRQTRSQITRITYYTRAASAAYDAAFASRLKEFDAAGIEPLITVHDFFPYSALDPKSLPWVIVPQLVQRFPGRLWQVGNEWNAHPGYGGGDYAYAMHFTLSFAKQKDPTARFVGMGLASLDNQAAFTEQYNAWRMRWSDADYTKLTAWAFHCYGVDLGRCITTRGNALRAILPNVELWVTESGTDRAGIEGAWGPHSVAQLDEVQAQQTQTAIDAARALGITRLYFYQLLDGPDDAGFSFFRHNGTMRPAGLVVRSANQ